MATFSLARKVKKTALKEFENIRTTGIIALALDEGDALVRAEITTGKDHIMLITKKGLSIRFKEREARPMGRSARGVTGIKFKKKDDEVIGMPIIPEGKDEYDVIVVSSRGYGKKTGIKEYRPQTRGGSGLITYSVSEKTGDLVVGRIEPGENTEKPRDILVATESGKVIRLKEKALPRLSRGTLGVHLIKLSGSDKVSSMAFLE